MEVEVGVPPLKVHQDSIQAKFRVRLEEPEAVGVFREAVEKVEGVNRCGSGRRKTKKEKKG